MGQFSTGRWVSFQLALTDERVQQFVDWSITTARFELHRAGASHPTIIDINRYAWQLLKEDIRGDARHRYDDDFDAAAAEHYMYIRFLASLTGDPLRHAAPSIYAASKILDQLLGKLQKGRVNDGHPVLPSNPYVVAWGNKGVRDGLTDYKQVTGGKPYNPGRAVEVLAGFKFDPETAKKLGSYATRTFSHVVRPYTQ